MMQTKVEFPELQLQKEVKEKQKEMKEKKA